MFNLETAITEWRQQMLAVGIETPVPLEELENHLREDVEKQVLSGTDAQEAFECSAGHIGQPAVLKDEFANAGETLWDRLKRILSALAGMSNPQLANSMNTINSNIEPRWAAYAKAGAFIFPATFLWLFTVIFVLPKANEICQTAGTRVFDLANAPAVFRDSAVVGQALIFLTRHGMLMAGLAIVGFVLIEKYFRPWPRYRRLTLNLGVFLLNAVVLVSLTLMIVSIIVAAPSLVQPHGH